MRIREVGIASGGNGATYAEARRPPLQARGEDSAAGARAGGLPDGDPSALRRRCLTPPPQASAVEADAAAVGRRAEASRRGRFPAARLSGPGD